MLRHLLILGSLVGCLEKVTGEPVALDARFTVQPGSGSEGDDTGGPGHTEMTHEAMEHVAVLPPQPFEDFEGERVLVSGTISGDVSVSVDLDVAHIDETTEGGLVSEGKLRFDGPGDFELSVPVSAGWLKLSAFQDIEEDGPSLEDPYAELDIEVGTEAITSLVLNLEAGGRQTAMDGPEHVEVLPPQPFEDFEGERVSVSGTISGDAAVSVDLDVARIDETAEGGLVSEGKLLFDGPGDFELSVPVSAGWLKLSAFQDMEEDGPSLEDPYAELDIEVGTEEVTSLELALVIGARGKASGGPEHADAEHVDAPPGFGSGQAPPADGQPTGGDPFEGVEGERVTVSGVLVYAGEGVIDVDLFKADASAPGGRSLLGKLKKQAGPFVLQVPIAIGTMELDAFADRTGDGPSGDDPRGSVRGLVLTEGAVRGLELKLVALSEVPQAQPEDPGGTDIEEEFARTGAVGKE